MSFRILLVGADSGYAIERSYRKYLANQPAIEDLKFFAAQNYFLDYYRKNIFNKLLFRMGLSRILHSINARLEGLADEFRPDIVLLFKGMEIYPSTLKNLKAKGIRLVNYNPDNPFIFSGRGSGNSNVRRSVALFDLYLSYDREVCRGLTEQSGVTSALLPFGFDIDEELFNACANVTEIPKACFIGNPDKNRAAFLNELAEHGVCLDIYGFGWEKWSLHPDLSVKGYLSGDDLWIKLRAYRLQLNLMRPHNLRSHNMRTFEIPAVGGIQLAPDTPDHRLYFEPEKEIFLFDKAQDCADSIRRLLNLSQFDVSTIRHYARVRCLDSGYSYRNRAKELLSILTFHFSAD